MLRTTKHVLIFLAGAAAWNGLMHLLLKFSNALPITMMNFTITPMINTYITIGSFLIALALLYFANQRPTRE